MKIATWNVNSLNVRLPRLLAWLPAAAPDVVCLQETQMEDAKFPRVELLRAGYRTHFSGQRTYNGVALLLREGLGEGSDIVTTLPDFPDEQKRVIAATIGDLRVVNFYVPNGQSVDSDKYRYKLAWGAAATRFLRDELARHARMVVVGDLNIAPEDRDVHEPALWEGQVLCSEPERALFRDWLALGLRDSFRLFEQPPRTFSWSGLPAARVPEESRPAHRPHPALRAARGTLQRLPHRPRHAQGRQALGPRAGDRGVRVTRLRSPG